jgi:hypothetical protein
MLRISFRKILRWCCLTGLIASLLLWVLPASFKPYRVRRALFADQNDLVETATELGLAANGVVRVLHAHEYSGGTVAAIDQIRRHWDQFVSKSNNRWPVDSRRLTYDTWDASHWIGPDGVNHLDKGEVICLPYSLIAIACAVMLLGDWMTAARSSRR